MHSVNENPDEAVPLLSVVTVSLNSSHTIEDTLASVHLQRPEFPVQHVCVDGGSTDGTREIIDHWAQSSPGIHRVFEPDSGIYDAMNKGLRAARGEYVLYLNADDFLVSADTLSRVFAGIRAGAAGNPDLLVGDVVMGDPGRRGLWRRRRVPRIMGRVRGLGFFPLHQAMFAKRRLLEAVGGFDTRWRIAGDVNQFYDLERRFRPSLRFLDSDVAFMRAGGAANAGLRAIYRGSMEIYRHLRPHHGAVRSALMLAAKTAQSVSEVRFGTPPHRRWFESGLRASRKSA